MGDSNSEYFIQLFLFSATIFCYVLLFLFITYGIYYCCIRSCLKVRRRRMKERKIAEENFHHHHNHEAEGVAALSYPGKVTLISPFESNVKATIVPSSNSNTLNQPQQQQHSEDMNNSNEDESQSNNYFTDKKYYDIFHA